MIAWSFRRLRSEMMAVAVALAGVGLLAIVTGRAMSDHYRTSGLASCLAGAAGRDECRGLIDTFDAKFGNLQILIVPVVLLPALFGAFVGGPLVARDVEAGTHRFFWTQSITRRRWLASSTGAVLVAVLVAGTALSLITASWLSVTNRVTDERFGQLYDMQGIVPIAATFMAAAIGTLAGAALRRTLPAMAVTLGSFIVVRVPLAVFARPRLIAPRTIEAPSASGDPLSGTNAWVLSRTLVDSRGAVLAQGDSLDITGLFGACPSLRGGSGMPHPDDVEACLGSLGARNIIRYHPGDRFWIFQIIESLIMVGIGAAAVGIAFGVVRRKIS